MNAASAAAPDAAADALLARISAAYPALSKQLKAIALHVEKNRDQVGIEGIQELARQCGVQPSAVVRFAQHFGFSGFSALQAVFRDDLARQLAPGRNYRSRIRDLIESGPGKLSSTDIAREFLAGSVAGMQELQATLDSPSFDAAVELLVRSETVWIVGARRAFPVAAYLEYALQHTGKRVCLVSGLGGMQMGQMRSVHSGDAMVAVSFAPYAQETLQVVQAAGARGAQIIALTDSRMSPIAQSAQAVLVVQESATMGFRALSSTMGLAQSLFIALAYALELSHAGTVP
jgi:hypothetical protein